MAGVYGTSGRPFAAAFILASMRRRTRAVAAISSGVIGGMAEVIFRQRRNLSGSMLVPSAPVGSPVGSVLVGSAVRGSAVDVW